MEELRERIKIELIAKCPWVDTCKRQCAPTDQEDCYGQLADAITLRIKEFGYLSPEEVEKRIKDTMYYYLDITNPCPACGGRGKRSYSSTATWHGGIGGQMITTAICDKCWGSGDADIHWTNLRVLQNLMTPEQRNKYTELAKTGI